MPVLAFPGPSAPPPPGVTLEVPDGWAVEPAGTGLLRAHGVGSAGDPVEVDVAAHAVAPDVRAEDLVERVTTSSAPGGSELEPVFVVEIGGREWAGRNVSWDEASGPVVEVVLATAGAPSQEDPGRFVVATGRVRGGGLEDDYDTLQSVLETLTVRSDA